MKRQSGFTLIELLITVIVIGVVGTALMPWFNNWLTASKTAYFEKHQLNNQTISSALLNFATTSTQYGRLPKPFTGGGYVSTIYNPADATVSGTELAQSLTMSGVNPNEINDDGTSARKVRVYQLVPDLMMQVPLNFQSGPLVMLTFDYGAIYLTTCTLTGSVCNPAPSGVPGVSPEMNGLNYSTWKSVEPDGAATFVSSLPIQKQMLATTVQRLDKVRDTLLTYLRTQQVTGAGGDKTNWFPNQAGASAAGILSGGSPATNQGCRDGWYDLNSATVTVLQTVGLSPEEFGSTAWGGAIQYCRDYDATAVKVPNTPPHYGAIRILRNVSVGLPPDAAVAGNNIVLTF